MTPDVIPMPAAPVTLWRWRALLEQLRAMRALQSEYNRTIDPMVRRRMERAEAELDAAVGWLVADLAALDAAGIAAEVEAEAESAEFAAGLLPAAPTEGGAV
jgi:hypothetical protein